MSKRDVDLIIRAQDRASKQTNRIVESLTDLESIQKAVAQSSNLTGAEIDALTAQINRLSSSGKATTAFKAIQKAVDAGNVSLNRQETELREVNSVMGSYQTQIAAAVAALKRLKAEAAGDFGPIPPDAAQKVNLVAKSLASLEREFDKTSKKSAELSDNVTRSQRSLMAMDAEADQAATALKKVQQQEANLGIELQKTAKARETAANREKMYADRRMADVARMNAINSTHRAQMAAVATATNQANTAQQRLATSTRTAGDSAKRSVTSWQQVVQQLRLIQKESRQSLGLMQRMRGQLLSLGAAYVGVFGAQRAIGSVIGAGMNEEATTSRFLVAFAGDQAKPNEEMAFARKVSQDLALSYRVLAPEYAKLAIAAKGTVVEGQGVQNLFVAMAQSARTNKFTTDELGGAYKALTQILSKGKFTAEEIRMQLGDRMPGAFTILADALGKTTAEVDKFMQDGKVGLDAMAYFAAEMSKRSAPALDTAMTSMSAAIGRFDNSLYDLQVRVAQSGFLDALTDALNSASVAMTNPDVQEGAVKLGEAFAQLVTWLVESTKYAEEWIAIAKLLAYWMGARFMLGMITDLTNLAGKLKAGISLFKNFVLSVKGSQQILARFAPLLATISAGVVSVAAVFAAWKLSDWAYKNFSGFRRFSIQWFGTLMSIFDSIKIGWAGVATFFSTALKNPLESVVAYLAEVASKVIKLGSLINKALGNQTISTLLDGLEIYVDGLTVDFTDKWKAEFDRQEAEIRKAAANRDKILFGMIRDTYKRGTPTADAPPLSGPGAMVIPPPTGAWGPTGGEKPEKVDAQVKKIANTIDSLRQKLAELLSKDMTLTLEQQLAHMLAAIDSEYSKIYKDLDSIGKGRGSAEWGVVDALVAQEKLLARQKIDQEIIKRGEEERREAESQINALMQTRRDLLQNAEFAKDAGDMVAYDQIGTKVAEITATLNTAIDAQLAYWQAAGSSEESEAAIARLQAQKNALVEVSKQGILTAKTFGQTLGNSVKSFGDDFLSTIRETGDVFQSLRTSFLQFASDFLLKIAQMILQQAVLNALQGSSFGGTTVGKAMISVLSNHGGGVAGSGMSRSASPSWFANAPRYHTGGIAGLRSDEVPSILKRGEEVLTENDPRHRNNGNGANSGINIINTFDAGEFLEAALGSPAGQQTLLNSVTRNKQKFKSALS